MEHFHELFKLLREFEFATGRPYEIYVEYLPLYRLPLLGLSSNHRVIYVLGDLDEAVDWLRQVVRARRKDAKRKADYLAAWGVSKQALKRD